MKKCLIIDDVQVSRYTMDMFLEELGYTCTEAVDTESAFEALKKDRFDVVILDWHLKKEDGLAAIENIKSTAQGAKIIVISGVEGADKASEARKAGAAAFVEKPTSKDKLEKALKESGAL